MASLSISKSVGQTEFQIVAGTAVPGAGNIELRVDLATLPPGNIDVLLALEEFANWWINQGAASDP